MHRKRKFVNEGQVKFKAARAGGPGGQKVNRRSTKVQLWVKIGNLPISESERRRLRAKLSHHINHLDELWVQDEEERSQEMNRDRALERLNRMIEEALKVPKKRIPTEPRRSAVKGRIKEKKILSEKKRARRASHKSK